MTAEYPPPLQCFCRIENWGWLKIKETEWSSGLSLEITYWHWLVNQVSHLIKGIKGIYMIGKTIYWLYENSPQYHLINSFIRSFFHSSICAFIRPSPNRTPSPQVTSSAPSLTVLYRSIVEVCVFIPLHITAALSPVEPVWSINTPTWWKTSPLGYPTWKSSLEGCWAQPYCHPCWTHHLLWGALGIQLRASCMLSIDTPLQPTQ